MTTIELSVAPEAITGFNRIARHESFIIQRDLNMVQQIRVVTVDADGVAITDRIAQDASLSPVARQNAGQRYQDQVITRSTAGAFVELKTGKVVPEAGEGIVTQRDYFQGITLGALKAMGMVVTDKTSVAELLYALIGNEIGHIDARGDL